jgi:hypothetical protein
VRTYCKPCSVGALGVDGDERVFLAERGAQDEGAQGLQALLLGERHVLDYQGEDVLGELHARHSSWSCSSCTHYVEGGAEVWGGGSERWWMRAEARRMGPVHRLLLYYYRHHART